MYPAVTSPASPPQGYPWQQRSAAGTPDTAVRLLQFEGFSRTQVCAISYPVYAAWALHGMDSMPSTNCSLHTAPGCSHQAGPASRGR
jgi:hypothetical protein